MSTSHRRAAPLSAEKLALFRKRLQQKGVVETDRSIIPHNWETDATPLSFAQQRLWFLSQLEEGSVAYNNPIAIEFHGQLNVVVLEQSLHEIVRRHNSLRTTFPLQDGHPLQVVRQSTSQDLFVTDLSFLAESQCNALAQQLAYQEAQEPFDLVLGPLFRTTLLRLKPLEHVLLLTTHHIISDGWSEELLVQELITFYRDFVAGRPASLPELPIQYTDFALWQRQQLQGDALEQQLHYWRKQLEGILPLELPYDHPRPMQQTLHGAYQELILSSSQRHALQVLSQQEDVTLFMTLCAAFQVLIARFTGDVDIAVGTPIANRAQVELEKLIGFFVNTLVLRTDLSGNPTFRQLLSKVRDVTLGAYSHQDIPFEKVVEELHPEREVGRSPLFQVMFSLQQAPGSYENAIEGLRIVPFERTLTSAKFDLTLMVIDTGQELRSVVEYNTAVFTQESITRLLQYWQTLLTSILADPDENIQALPLLKSDEYQHIVYDFNASKRDYCDYLSLQEMVDRQVEALPDAMAVTFEEHSLTYRELNRRANQLAHFLQKKGVGPEQLVGVYLPRSLDLMVTFLGILKAGGVYMPT